MTRVQEPRDHIDQAASAGPQSSLPLREMLDDWVNAGIISSAQARRIDARARSEATGRDAIDARGSRSSLAIEALGYLGAVIVAVATILIAAQYWSDLTVSARLLIVGGAALALISAGLAVPPQLGDIGVRLRSVLWLTSTGAAAGFLVLLGSEVFDLTEADLALLVTAGTAVLSGILWNRHRVVVQQVVMMVALMSTAFAVVAQLGSDSLPGLGAWGVAVVWLLLGWGGILGPRRSVVALSAAAAVIAAMSTTSDDAGLVFAIATAATVVCTAVLFRDLVMLAVGAVGALLVLPQAVDRWFPGSLAAPMALLAVGVLLVSSALWIAARRMRHGPDAASAPRDYSVGRPTTAAWAAAGVVAVVVGTVLTVSLV
jgi:Predicted membrane protein (DUF2157)